MKVRLADGNITVVDEEDYYKYLIGRRARVTRLGYVWVTKIGMLHRAILDVQDPNILVDHRDRDKLNNQKSNLRLATKSTNGMNRPKPINNTSGYKGVKWNKERSLWDVNIQANSKNKFVGRFDTVEEAAKVYDFYARKFHGEFAMLNFPDINYTPPKIRRKVRRGNSQYKGVSFVKASGKFSARCRVRRFAKFLGLFNTEKEAVDIYDAYVISCGIPEYANFEV